MIRVPTIRLLLLSLLAVTPPAIHADIVTDWNARTATLVNAAKVPPPTAARVFAGVQTAVYEALRAVAADGSLQGADAVVARELAVAIATRDTLLALLPEQRAQILAAHASHVSATAASSAGSAAGASAAAAVAQRLASDGFDAAESYRPMTSPGVYIPTTLPVYSSLSKRRPWSMTSSAEFRPGPPPSLDSEAWVRDYNESRALCRANSTTRTPEQTAIARFWETTGPAIYQELVRSAASAPGRTSLANARLFAMASQAMDDALIAVFEAKYQYGLWRPITAIRNGDRDNSPLTERDPSWRPLIDTPMHPEYPCAHCVAAGAIATVLESEFGTTQLEVSTSSPTGETARRQWNSLKAFEAEVSLARICAGVHYRNSTEVGTALGRAAGRATIQRFK